MFGKRPITMWLMGAACLLHAIHFTPFLVAGDTFYVRASGSDSNTGRAPTSAFRTVQFAVQNCVKSGGGYTIYVGPGTYTERVRITSTISPTPASGAIALPNRIIGDTSGQLTGDVGGRVVISGGSTQFYGIEVNARNYWQFESLSFTSQTTAAFNLMNAAGLSVKKCQIKVGASTPYAIYSEAYNSTFTDNTIVFAAAFGHGIYLRCPTVGSYTVERNRIWMTGANYLSTAYRGTPSLPVTYGVYANVLNDAALMTISITNNVITDRHTGCFVFVDSLLPTTSATVSSNTIVGTTYPINATVSGAALGSLINNIVASCYYGGAADMPLGTVSGLLEFDTRVGFSSNALVQTGLITGLDPLFVSASSGNFGLSPGSPAIDAGAALTGPAIDLTGRARPADGNRDALALPDLGAVEYGAPSGLRITAWNQKDQRNVPRSKLPAVVPIKIGVPGS